MMYRGGSRSWQGKGEQQVVGDWGVQGRIQSLERGGGGTLLKKVEEQKKKKKRSQQ